MAAAGLFVSEAFQAARCSKYAAMSFSVSNFSTRADSFSISLFTSGSAWWGFAGLVARMLVIVDRIRPD